MNHPEYAGEGADVTIQRDFSINTSNNTQKPPRHYYHNLHNMDISVQSDKNIFANIFERLSKGKDLEMQI